MERSSQVILRNAGRLDPGRLLLVNPPRDFLFRELSASDRDVQASTQDFGDFRWLADNGAEALFELLPQAADAARTVILHLPREKDRLNMMLQALAWRLPEDSRLWLVGENRAGIKSAGRWLAQYFGDVQKRDTARHCGLYEAVAPLKEKPFLLDRLEEHWQFDYSGSRIEIASLPGVFAHGRLDPGSRLLLEALKPLRPGGRILDFACGSGVIGLSLLSACPELQLTMLDVSSLAIESSRRSLQANGLDAELVASDGLSELNGRFDWIVSNPPFHSGVSNDLDIASRFFRESGTFLENAGKIVIVCNRHLPYEKWLKKHFRRVEHLASDRDYLVIQASRTNE